VVEGTGCAVGIGAVVRVGAGVVSIRAGVSVVGVDAAGGVVCVVAMIVGVGAEVEAVGGENWLNSCC